MEEISIPWKTVEGIWKNSLLKKIKSEQLESNNTLKGSYTMIVGSFPVTQGFQDPHTTSVTHQPTSEEQNHTYLNDAERAADKLNIHL